MDRFVRFVGAAVLFFGFFGSVADAADPRLILSKGKASFGTQDTRRGGSPESLQAAETAQAAAISHKNALQEPSNFLSAQAAPSLIEPSVTAPTQVGWSGGSTYPAIVYDPKIRGRAYTLSDSSGFYRSENGGATWQAANQGVVNLAVASLAIAPSNSNVLYMGSTAGVHRSNDAGKTWTFSEASRGKIPFKRLASYKALAVDALNVNKVYAGSSAGQVFHSADGGTSWTQVGTLAIGVPVSALHLTRDGRLFAGSSKGLMTYQGGTWQKVALKSDHVYDIVSIMHNGKETLYVTNGRNVAHSSDLGVPTVWWYAGMVPKFNAATDGWINRIAVRQHPRTGKVEVLASLKKDWNGRLFLGTNHGESWKEIGLNFNNDPLANPTREWKKSGANQWLAVAFDPFNTETFTIADDWGLWKTTDSGASWNESIAGTPNVMGTSIVRDPLTGTYLVGTMDNGLVELNPQTGAMKAVFPNASTPWQLHGHVWKAEVLPNGNRILAVSPWNSASNVVVVVRPDGTTALANGLPALYPKTNTVWEKGYMRTLAVDPSNPDKLYLGIDGNDGGGLYVSTDGGLNWARSAGQPASLRVYNGLAVDPVETNRLFWGAMGSGGGVYRSLDAGGTWTRVFTGSYNVSDVVVGPDQTVYAGGDTGGPALYVSRDKGATWGMLKKFEGTGTLQAITIDPNDPKRMVVSSRKWGDSTGAKVYFTADAGKTWKEVAATGLPNTSGAADAVFSQDGKSLYLLMTAGSLYQVPLP